MGLGSRPIEVKHFRDNFRDKNEYVHIKEIIDDWVHFESEARAICLGVHGLCQALKIYKSAVSFNTSPNPNSVRFALTVYLNVRSGMGRESKNHYANLHRR